MHQLSPTNPICDLLDPYRSVFRRPVGDRPWVMANMVTSLDGSASIQGRVGRLSEGDDAVLFKSMRSLADVVLVGAETVRAEGYGPVRLTDALKDERVAAGRTPVPRLAVVTKSLKLDWSSSIFHDEPTPYVIAPETAEPDALAVAAEHAEVITSGVGRVDLAKVLSGLADVGHQVVLTEGGPTLLGELAHLDLLDELCLSVAPLMGGDPLPISVSPSPGVVKNFALQNVAASGSVLFLRYERV